MKRVCFICEKLVDVEQIPLEDEMSPSISICDYCQQLDYNGEYLNEILEKLEPKEGSKIIEPESVKIGVDIQDITNIMDCCQRIKNPSVKYLDSQLGMANQAIEICGKEAYLIIMTLKKYLND